MSRKPTEWLVTIERYYGTEAEVVAEVVVKSEAEADAWVKYAESVGDAAYHYPCNWE